MSTSQSKNTFKDSSLTIGQRLDLLIEELTLDEKLHMLASGSGGVERLGIPECRLGGEAAHGVEARNDQNGIGTCEITTSFPEPIGMSSSWDPDAIRAAGETVGREARAVYARNTWGGISRWAPTVDLLRDPRWGRNEEAYGEDPVQVGAMASAYIRGMQGNDPDHITCAATLKHFYANNAEIGRGWKNSSISPRNKFELYLEPFRRCIEDGSVEGIMTAYNRINGVQGLFNTDVKDILKDEFGLTHAVSDGGAMELTAAYSHATAMDAETAARSIRAGVDALSGRPAGVYAAVSEAYDLGLLTEEDIDTAIRNVYKTRIRLGILDEDAAPADPATLCDEASRQACKTLTDRSVVLLKNDGVLPIRDDDLTDAVLIGPVCDKWYMDWYGGEAPEHISLLDGICEITARNGQNKIRYVDACDRIRLKCRDRYLAVDPEGRYRLSDEADTLILEDWGEESYTLLDERTGKYMITQLTGDAIIGIAAAESGTGPSVITGNVCAGSDRIFSWFDLEVFRLSTQRNEHAGSETVILRDRFGNRLYADQEGCIVSACGESDELTPLTFTIETIEKGIDKAIEAASGAGRVILALGHNPMVNAKEEIDRSTIEFIPCQQKLFDEVQKVNPNIIVVLMSDYPFAINEINDKARAILWSATGSQCMGRSLADALTGRFSPAGRLTQTWFASDAALPDIDDYDIIGSGRTYRYYEGDVLYPFGFGLTYAEFRYSDMKLTTVQDEYPVQDDLQSRGSTKSKKFGQPNGVYTNVRNDNRILKIDLTVTNTGNHVSDEVVQIYAKAPRGRVKKPIKQLIGFERVKDIAPGEERNVEFRIPVRELAYYDVVSESLIIEDGSYEITAASSSTDTGVSASVQITGAKRGLRDLSKRIKADHYDDQTGTQIVEGLYGYSALMSAGPGTYEPEPGSHFSAVYEDCILPEDVHEFRIHGIAYDDTTLKVFVDDDPVGEITLNTRDYTKRDFPVRNHMPRAAEAEKQRRCSFPILWADIRIPIDTKKLGDLSEQKGHTLRLEAAGRFKYDWFMMV